MAREATVKLNVQIGDGATNAERLEGSLEEVGVAALEAGDDLERMSSSAVEASSRVEASAEQAEAALQSQAAATSRVRGSTSSFGNAAQSTAAQLSVDLTQSAQDAAFGLENLAASAPFLQEQFSRLQRQSGGVSSAFGALFSAMKGPTGIIAAFTLLVTFKDQIINFFSDTATSADEAKEAISEAADAITDFEDFEVAGLDVGPSDVEPTLRALRGELSRIAMRRELLSQRIAEIRANVTGALEAQRQITDVEAELQRLDERERQVEGFIDKLEQQEEAYNTNLDLRRLITEETGLAVNEQGQLTEETEDAADAAERYVSAFSGPDAFQISENLQQLRGFMRRRRRGTAAREGMGPGFGLPSGTQLATGAMRVGGAIGAARSDRQAIRSSLQMARQMGLLQEQAESLPELFGRMESEQEGTNFQLEQGIQLAAQLGTTMVQAAQQGGAEWNQVLGSVLTTIGTAVGAANPAAGAAIAGTGQLIGSFQSGGTAQQSGFARLHPPEMVFLPEGSRVTSRQETQQAMEGMGGDENATVRAIRGVSARLDALDLRADEFGLNLATEEAQGELERTGGRVYDSAP